MKKRYLIFVIAKDKETETDKKTLIFFNNKKIVYIKSLVYLCNNKSSKRTAISEDLKNNI